MDEIYLVIGANGAQGGAVARRLLAQGRRVRGLTRTGPGIEGIEWVTGDLADPAAMSAAFDGVTHASVTLPIEYDPAVIRGYVHNVIEGAARSGVRRLVFNSATRPPATSTPVAVFETRREAADAFLHSGIPAVGLCPVIYLDNLCGPWVAPALVNDGVLAYPIPADIRVSWLSHDDLAKITVAALHRDELVGSVVDLHGPEPLTGPELAAAFSAVLDREVTYTALPVDAFEAGLARAVGPKLAADVAATYRWLTTPDRAGAYAGDGAKVEDTFGIRLTPVRDWIATQPWQSLAAR